MRFIGSKIKILPYIENTINNHIKDGSSIFIDLFAGTGVVGEYFKSDYQIFSNDSLFLSYILNKAKIECNNIPSFLKLRQQKINDPLDYLVTSAFKRSKKYFITENYSPYKENKRMYFTTKNAERIDYIRITIENWVKVNLIDKEEYYYLLACLLEAVSTVSNTTGTYGAYLKKWDPRALKDINLSYCVVKDNKQKNKVYNKDANLLAEKIKGDICYIDPPYNNRQYYSNYHLLETISKYDYPEIAGITGIRNTAKYNGSLYSRKKSAYNTFEDLISKINSKHLIISYNSDGILSKDEITSILLQYGIKGTYHCYEIPYQRYQGKKILKKNELKEYLFYIQKNIPLVGEKKKIKLNYKASVFSKELLASPMNYIGGKYKLLDQLLPLFPKSIDTFVDLFAGGLNVGINVKSNKMVVNDINKYIIEILEMFSNTEVRKLITNIKHIVLKYELSKTNREGFLKLRLDYNEKPEPLLLYILVCYSFNYQFRFNNNHEYNNPFGKDRSHFSNTLKNKLIRFVTRLQKANVIFTSNKFEKILSLSLTKNDFVYCDPPYLITTGSYNDGNRGFKNWTVEQEKKLYSVLDSLSRENIPFAFSNVTKHKGKENLMLKKWIKSYNVHYLEKDYSNSSHNTKKGESIEVLITNY